MERSKALLGGVLAIIVIFGGVMVIRIITRLIAVAIWFAEMVAVFFFACLIGYIIYRILLGDTDDPRYG